MKKVLVNFVALHGGGTADAMQMINGLVNNGCEVYALISKNMENFKRWKEIEGLNVISVNGYTSKINFFPRLVSFYLFEIKKIRKVIKTNNIEIMYIPMISYWTYYIWKKFKNMKCIYTMHDVIPHDNNTNSILWKWSKKLAVSCNDIVVLSNCFKDIVKREYKKSESNIHIIPLGNQLYYGNESLKKKSDRYELVFYGRVDKYKGLDNLAIIYKRLLEKHDNIHLTIAASGNFDQYKKEYLGIPAEKITIINRWIEDAEVPGLFAYDKSITLLPYKNATQSGIIPIAMQHKSLLISSDCSGLAEQISDGQTGFLVKPNDIDSFINKVDYAINNWEEMESIIDQAYSYIQTLSWDSLSKRLMEEIDYDNN